MSKMFLLLLQDDCQPELLAFSGAGAGIFLALEATLDSAGDKQWLYVCLWGPVGGAYRPKHNE